MEASDENKAVVVHRVVPQGFILDTMLWDVMYNDPFEIGFPEKVTLIDFAEDVALAIVAISVDSIVARANVALDKVAAWKNGKQLELVPSKAVLFTRKRIVIPI